MKVKILKMDCNMASSESLLESGSNLLMIKPMKWVVQKMQVSISIFEEMKPDDGKRMTA